MDYTNINNENIVNWLKINLDEERFLHTLGTADRAVELAKKYNLNPQKAYIAGLLHDCAKCFSNKKMLEIIHEHLDVEKCEMLNHKTLHAPVSAYIAETEFGVTDLDILSAIRWHTLGKIEMNNFDKIIFLADKIEPNTREKSYVNKMNSILEEYEKENGLNKALLECYKETIKSLIRRDLKICTITIDIYNKLQDIVNVSDS